MSTTFTCANCGKGGEGEDIMDLKFCTACKMVKYCNRECQIAHRPQHKKLCKKRAIELHDKALFKEPPPPEDECPICMLPLPPTLPTTRKTFNSCCGKDICDGCIYAMGDTKNEHVCPFCKTPNPRDPDEDVERIKNLIEKGNVEAMYVLEGCYNDGSRGVTQNKAKANELWLKAGELGFAPAYYNLGSAQAEVNMKRAKHYWELAAIMGDVVARYNLGVFDEKAGNNYRAMKHYAIAASAGHKVSLDAVKDGYMDGYVTKDQYTKALRSYQTRQDEAKSDTRDKALAESLNPIYRRP